MSRIERTGRPIKPIDARILIDRNVMHQLLSSACMCCTVLVCYAVDGIETENDVTMMTSPSRPVHCAICVRTD